MKELTIEQKAKRYDDVIRKAKITLDCCTFDSTITEHIVYDIFPELKKLDDNTIRNAIIDFFESQNNNTTYSFIPKKDILTWLEKHDENTLIEEIKRRKEILLEEKENAVSYTENISLGARIATLEELLAFISEKE